MKELDQLVDMVEDAMNESIQVSEIGLQDFGLGSTTPMGVSKKELKQTVD